MVAAILTAVVWSTVKAVLFPTGAVEPNAETGNTDASEKVQFDVLVVTLVVRAQNRKRICSALPCCSVLGRCTTGVCIF